MNSSRSPIRTEHSYPSYSRLSPEAFTSLDQGPVTLINKFVSIAKIPRRHGLFDSDKSLEASVRGRNHLDINRKELTTV